jgi:hypothetical protein
MSEYSELEYEINEMFDYVVLNPKGYVSDIIKNINIDEKNVKIVLNIFAKNNLIEKIKIDTENGYSFQKDVSIVTFAKAINLGVELSKLEKERNYKGTNKDIFNFIKSGEFDEAIEEEENNKKIKFIENIEKQSREQLKDTPIGFYKKILEDLVSEDFKSEHQELKDLISEIKASMDKEFDSVSNKLVNKKTSTIKK